MRTRSIPPLLAAALMLGATAACSDNSGEASDPPSSSAPSTQPPESSGSPDETTPPARLDGVLRIGVLLPQSGPGNEIGIAGVNAVNEAVNAINGDGGVLGSAVEVEAVDEGDSLTTANAAIDALLAENVDAVIGPASSTVALGSLDRLTDEGVVVCSPTANSMALDSFPDNGLFIRTVPSDSIAALAIAQVAEQTGVDEVTVAYLDDAFGRPFARRTIERLNEFEIVSIELPFDADADPAASAQQMIDNPTRTIVVIADAANGWEMVSAIASVVNSDDPPTIIINDAMRTPDPALVLALDTEVREQIQGVSPVFAWANDEPAGWYATNALHCANLLALAAVRAGTDDPAAIAGFINVVSVAGTPCVDFAECRRYIDDDRDVNYQGPGPAMEIAADGDLSRGRFGSFRYNEQGVDYPFGGTYTITDRDDSS